MVDPAGVDGDEDVSGTAAGVLDLLPLHDLWAAVLPERGAEQCQLPLKAPGPGIPT